MPVTFKTRTPLADALFWAGALEQDLLALPSFHRVQVCGSVRRRKDTVGDLDLVVDGDLNEVKNTKGKWTWMEGGEAKATIEYHGMQVNLLRSDENSWGAAIFYFTGPHDYNIAYRRRAKGLGMLLNEKGLFSVVSGACIASRTEHEIYRALGKVWKRPEERGA
jgi:DNA polymerase (family 10)